MRRVIHTMLRVGDMKRAIDFYTRIMGMKVLREEQHPEEGYALTFVGYADESDSCVIELTCNEGVTDYELGNAFGHIAIGVDDCYSVCDAIRRSGGNVVRDAGPRSGSDETIAFIVDPDGYKIELVSM